MNENARRLILVKHAMPTIDPDVPAATWRLSDDGRRACSHLARRLAAYAPAAIVGSTEPKATETAALVAAALGLPVTSAPGLHEHDLGDTSFLGEGAWQATIARFFAEPDALVFGRETATAACRRFVGAVTAVLDAYPDGNVVVVAHGRVISLLVAQTNPVDPYALWGQLGLPSFVVLSVPRFALQEVVGRVDTSAGI